MGKENVSNSPGTGPRPLLAPLGPPVPAIAIPPEELKRLGLDEPVVKHPPDKVADFVHRVQPAAQLAAAALNVPIEAVISQWALESGWGTSELAAKYNNLGGIKAFGNWTGKKVSMPSFEKNRTVKEVSPFRVYDDLPSYGRDYASFLSTPRYANVRGTNTVRDFAIRLGQAGYHQDDPNSYASQLESIARRVSPLLQQTSGL